MNAEYEKHLREVFLPRREKLLELAKLMADHSEGKLELRTNPAKQLTPLDPDTVHILVEPDGKIWGQFYVEEFVSIATATDWANALVMFGEDVARFKEEFPVHAREVSEKYLQLAESEFNGPTCEKLRQYLLGS